MAEQTRRNDMTEASHVVPERAGRSAQSLAADGPFASNVEDFAVRPAQIEMSARIEEAIAGRQSLVCESATGTGKTLAYLVPVLLSGRRTIISTGTRALQEQLFRKDLPLAQAVLRSPIHAVLLKGRSNYLCWERLALVDAQTDAFSQDRGALRQWAAATETGDLSEAPGLAEEASLWRSLTVTADECLGSACRSYDRCHVQRARREAAEADLVVVNHHLFFADLLLGNEGFGRLLPDVETVIFDEAHQLPALASEFFGVTVAGNQMLELCRDLRRAEQEEQGLIVDLPDRLRDLEASVAAFAVRLSAVPPRCALVVVRERPEYWTALLALHDALAALLAPFAETGVRGDRTAGALRRGRTLLERLVLIIGDERAGWVAWIEVQSRAFTLKLTPSIPGPEFRRQIDRDPRTPGRQVSWIFLSATLCVRDSFAHFVRSLSIEDASTARWDSPFDYRRQALLYLPPGLPEPGDRGYGDALIDHVIPVLEASRGRAFILFTTHRALAYARDRLRTQLPFPTFVQGEASRGRLIEQFRASGNGVLLGTGSFWEGVDVAGEALSCVIIDKLPFAPPDDPVEQARARDVAERGGSGFRDHQLPQAVVALKQGAGRLIRTASDRGVLVLCDPRIRTRSYGRLFLDSLPPMPVTAEIAEVQRFFADRAPSAEPVVR